VGTDGGGALGLDVLAIRFRQLKAGSELGFLQVGEGLGDLVGHALANSTSSHLFNHPINSVPDAES
jgi:hypothetical protein